MVTNNYRIENDRLEIKYYSSKLNNFSWKKIPYEDEVEPMLRYIHYNNLHLKKEAMSKKVLEYGFFWAGFSKSIEKFIKNCGTSYCKSNILNLEHKPKIIKTNGPHIRYQADIWYLPNYLKSNNEFKYVLDCIDHFSKWCYSFLLKNKSSDLVVSKIKSFIEINGKCSVFQTDNGTEFKNESLKIYLENNDIKYVNSAPYHPQSNGCCESIHKEIKKFLQEEFEKKKNDFDIEVAIINAIIYHNNRVLSSTGYKPNDIRNIADDKIIQEVTNNIVKSMKRKVDKYTKCPENTLLLITKNIILKGENYILRKNKIINDFNIPGKLIKYVNDDIILLSIQISLDKDEIIKKNNNIKINIDCCRIIDFYGYNYYMEKNGELSNEEK